MKKSFQYYVTIWAVFFAAFHAVVFSVPSVIPEYPVKYDSRFWIAWGLISVGFLVNLLCAFIAFRSENLQKLFYNLPLITVSRTVLIAVFIIGIALMLIPNYPKWIAVVVCIIVIAFQVIVILKAAWASDVVQSIDERTKEQTTFIRRMTAEAEMLVSRAKSDAIREECKKVYEALRYSDPRSCEELSEVEERISLEMHRFATAVAENTVEDTLTSATEVVHLIKERNTWCKGNK